MAQPKQHAIRRSTRLPLEVPIRVTSRDPGLVFSEECTTTLVNAHGCGLITQHSLPRDLSVELEIVKSGSRNTARVADVVSLGGEPETWLLGMELDTPGNFWGIEYAPSDWKIEGPPSQTESTATPADETASPEPESSGRRWRLTDISAGACYLEAPHPMPIGSPVLISVRVAGHESLLDGVVRASHPEGIGVEFTSRDHRQHAGELIQRLVEHREVPRVFVGRKEDATQEASAAMRRIHADADQDDPLLELVRQGGMLSLEDFLDDLKAQRLGERREPRIEVVVPVRLRGKDMNGKPFTAEVKTRNVSRRGAQLENVDVKLRSGDQISINCGGASDDFRISWVGGALTSLAGQIGVVPVAGTTSIWDAAMLTPSEQPPQVTRPVATKRR